MSNVSGFLSEESHRFCAIFRSFAIWEPFLELGGLCKILCVSPGCGKILIALQPTTHTLQVQELLSRSHHRLERRHHSSPPEQAVDAHVGTFPQTLTQTVSANGIFFVYFSTVPLFAALVRFYCWS